PTLAATQLPQNVPDDEAGEDEDDEAHFSQQLVRQERRRWVDESQSTEDSIDLLTMDDSPHGRSTELMQAQSSILNSQSLLESFDAMPNEMKTFMMYQLLRRCTRKTLRVVADVVNPALKCDFLKQLPTELCLNVLSFLDHRDLCRAAQVSKHWRNIVDSN